MRISDVMTPDVAVISPGSSVRDAARKMDQLNVGSLPVCDGGRLLGMVTDRDIVVRCAAFGSPPAETRIGEIMSRHVRWCFADDRVEEVENEMAAAQIRRMPVVDRDKNLIGIVALGDLATSDAPGTRRTLRRISWPSEPDRSGEDRGTAAARGKRHVRRDPRRGQGQASRGDDGRYEGSDYFEGLWSQYGNDDVRRRRRGEFASGRESAYGMGFGASGTDESEVYFRAPDDQGLGAEAYDRIYERRRERPVFDRASEGFSVEQARDYRGRGPRGYRRSDERIKEELGERMLDDSDLDASGIEIEVEDREVTLDGTVADRFARRRAEDIAESISGVEHVQNNLRVAPDGMRSGK
jgi:CBS domain-containing protein